MNDTQCILTIGDFSTLKALDEQWSGREHDLAPLLRAKLETAKVVFPDDLPRDVASLGSRIAYAVGEEAYVTVLTDTLVPGQDCLPITLPVGLALLGQREGWATVLEVEPSRPRSITLGRVIEQPEASRPGRVSPDKSPLESQLLRFDQSARRSPPFRARSGHPDDEDPGPAAA